MSTEDQNIEGASPSEALLALQGLEVSQDFQDAAPELEKQVFGEEQKEQAAEGSENNGEQPLEGEQAEQSQEEGVEQSQQSNEDSSDDDIYIEHEMFGGKKKVVEKNEEANEPIENKEAVEAFLKSTGLDLDVNSFADKVKNWQESEKQLDEKSKALENVEKLFSIMPPELYEAVNAVATGKDWRATLQSAPTVDYTKSVDELEEKQLVDAFFPDSISDEDWEEFKDEDGDPRVKKAVALTISNAKAKFNDVKASKEREAQDAIAKQQQAIEAYNNSIKSAVSVLPQKIEGISDVYVKSIESELQKPNSIRDLFFDENGIMKQEAALAYVMAKDGMSLLDRYKQIIEKRVETEKNLDMLSRGARAPRATSGTHIQGSGVEISPEVQKQLDFIRGLAK